MAGSLVAVAACGAARVIHQDQTTGVIELQGDHVQGVKEANQQMAAHCGANNFTVVSQGDEPIGTDTVTRQDQATGSNTSQDGGQAPTATTQRSTRTAWRIHYQCGGDAGGLPPGELPPPPSSSY